MNTQKINHSLCNIDALKEGEFIIPTEDSTFILQGTLKQFSTLTHRLCGQGLKHLSTLESSCITEEHYECSTSNDEYFSFTIKISLPRNMNPREFSVSSLADQVFDKILTTSSLSNRYPTGKRAIFLSNFEYTQSHEKIFQSEIILSKTVFYNDYRAVINTPKNLLEKEKIRNNLVQKLNNEFANNGLSFEIIIN